MMASKIASMMRTSCLVAMLAALATEHGVLGAPATSSADIAAATDVASDATNNSTPLCPGMRSTPVCCKKERPNHIFQGCRKPSPAADSVEEFVASCAEQDRHAQCCLFHIVRLPWFTYIHMHSHIHSLPSLLGPRLALKSVWSLFRDEL